MTAYAVPPYIAAPPAVQQPGPEPPICPATLDVPPQARLEEPMPVSPPPTKAELAAAARQARKHAAEAAALRANLLRRKAQARAAAKPAQPPGDQPKCP